MARHLVFIAVGEIVVIGQLVTGRDVPDGEQIDTFVFFCGCAVGFARMIYQRSHANAIDDSLAVRENEKISGGPLIVDAIGFLSSQASTRVFEDPSAFLDLAGGDTSATMNGGRTDLKSSWGFKGFHSSKSDSTLCMVMYLRWKGE